MTNKPMLSVEKILIGIDKDETEHPDGWWPNSVGAEFGAKKLQELRALLDNRPKPAAQHQGEPVVWVECSPAWLKAGGDCATAPRICVGREGISHLHPAHSSAEQPAPVADQTQCEECKGWGYHENHHDGGGTECGECGECGGSGNASVAVFMPDVDELAQIIRKVAGSHNLGAGSLAEAILEEVARLNGLKT